MRCRWPWCWSCARRWPPPSRDGTTRIVVLRGAGGHFCAGGDIKDMATARARLADDPAALARVNAAFGELCVAYAQTGWRWWRWSKAR
jgi:hypothetical protein